ncbi:glutamate synthase subunit beta [Candidatus Symbiobacter mobilis]|uniref:Glutamate synthase small subunit n=1 Tax=Candidatus Symbiobacter mobilis CR TaxID=946483 RepID=U5N8Q3_9BURK|nr:glutamate synthase subunit beta [Candidatus Symbiobacter mobilis]AGX87700.1 glutamate synthase small subunit [Candidatus Symbiobacter mobilis CR]
MGKITGFMELDRIEEKYEPAKERIRHYREFVAKLSDAEAHQQAARCMDCGTPFCNYGCPIHNIIPDFNDQVYKGNWERAAEVLHGTNNFPEITGRICPAPCEAACTLNIDAKPVGIRSIERVIADVAWDRGWVRAYRPVQKTGKRVAIVGSGPAGLAAAQQLVRAGHDIVVFEKNERAGGLLRYGIPDFKLDKSLIDRRIEQMQEEGVIFKTGVQIGKLARRAEILNLSTQVLEPEQLLQEFDAVLLAVGSECPRDLPVPGRELSGVHFAMELLTQQNLDNYRAQTGPIQLQGTHVIVIGGGDTGSDCVGTSNRHGAKSVTQFEVLPQPPVEENRPLTWPYWPLKLRTSSSHAEGCVREFAIATKAFLGDNGKLQGLRTIRTEWKDGQCREMPGTEQEFPADVVLLAMGFVHPLPDLLDAFGVRKDGRGNAAATTEAQGGYATSVAKVFAAGDVRRGQSLVVWAIREGRQAAHAIDKFLLGSSTLPW